MHKVRTPIIIVLVAWFLLRPAMGDGNDSFLKEVLWNYLDKLSIKVVFYASCAISPDTKAFVVIPSAGASGRFFVIQRNKLLLQIGDVDFQHDEWRVSGVTGGQQENAVAAKIGEALFRGNFEVLPQDKFRSILSDNPKQYCQ